MLRRIIFCAFILPFNSMKPKLCVNCKFFKNEYIIFNRFGKCSLFPKDEEPIDKNDIHFLVDGTKNIKEIEYYFCSTARNYDDMCGKEGKRFQQKK